MVLSKGSCIYFGPRAEAIPYFEALGFPLPVDKAYPDFIEELSAIPHKFYVPPAGRRIPLPPLAPIVNSNGQVVAAPPSTPLSPSGISLETAVTALIAAYRSSEAYDNVAHSLFGDLSPDAITKSHALTTSDNYRYNSSFFRQVALTAQRQFLMLARTGTALKASAIVNIICALVCGSLFWQMGHAQADARTRFGIIFFVLDFTAVGTNSLVPSFIINRDIFYPQKHRGFFPAAAYFFSQAVSMIPVNLMESFIIALIVYPMVGFHGTTFISEQWWYYWFTLFLFMVHATLFAYLCVA
jgi:hypothetical protein